MVTPKRRPHIAASALLFILFSQTTSTSTSTPRDDLCYRGVKETAGTGAIHNVGKDPDQNEPREKVMPYRADGSQAVIHGVGEGEPSCLPAPDCFWGISGTNV
jgi:hypothetical protein